MTLTQNNSEELEVTNRIRSANKSFYACNKLLSSRLLSYTSKLRLYKTIIRPVLLYASETWILNKKEERKVLVFENKILRKIFGPTLENGVWRIKHNQEIRQLFKEPDIVGEIKSRRLRWTGHVLRKEENSLAANILRNNPEGRRPAGRPKTRWWDQVRKDMRKMGLGEEDAADRTHWRGCVDEAKYRLGYEWPLQ